MTPTTNSTDTMADPPGYLLVHCAPQPAFAPVPLQQPVTYLGRIVGNDVVLNSANVSRRHAKLIVTDLGVTAHDLDSHNGIFLNGTRVRSTPVSVGDRLYIGDMCVQLQRGPSSSFDGAGRNTSVVRNELTGAGEQEPHARALATTLQVAHFCVDGADDTWAIDAVRTCRDLVDGAVAALVEIHEDGELDAPIILQPDGQRRDASVLWPVIHKVIASGELVFSRDVVRDGYVDVVGEGGLHAVIALPVVVGRKHTLHAILYLARAEASVVFSELEVDALQAVARLIAMRLDHTHQQAPPPGETTRIAGSLDVVQTRQQLAALEAQLGAEQEQLQQVTSRVHALESDNLRLRQQADIERNVALKKDAERERETLVRIEQAGVEARRQAQRDSANAAREQLQELQALVDAACSERDALLEASDHHRTELDAAVAEVAGAKADLAAAHTDLETIRGDQKAALRDISTLRLAVAGHESALSASAQELSRARAELAELQAERTQLRGEFARLEHTERAQQEHLDTLRRDGERHLQAAQHAEVLRSALRTSVLPTVVDHVDAIANGESVTTAAHTRSVTAVYVALADFDSWCATADASVVKRHLDRFCRVVAAQVIAHAGRIEQVVGHGHLLGFTADASGAVAAVHCALDIAHIVDAAAATEGDGNAPAVVAGLHVGVSVAGFFGDTSAVSYVEAGLPVIIARAAIDFAPKTHNGAAAGVIVSDAVRQCLGSSSGLRVTRLDPSWIRGVNAPVQLLLVDLDEKQRGAL